MTKLLDSYISEGDTVEFGEIQSLRVEIDSQNPRLTVIYTGETTEYTVLRKRVDDNHAEIQFPENAEVLGLEPNKSVRNAFVWYALPSGAYSFDGMEVDGE